MWLEPDGMRHRHLVEFDQKIILDNGGKPMVIQKKFV
jgi:hypothetical protein